MPVAVPEAGVDVVVLELPEVLELLELLSLDCAQVCPGEKIRAEATHASATLRRVPKATKLGIRVIVWSPATLRNDDGVTGPQGDVLLEVFSLNNVVVVEAELFGLTVVGAHDVNLLALGKIA